MHDACRKQGITMGHLIELVTFRHHGHAGHDPAEYVEDEVREFWIKRDPITRFEDALLKKGYLLKILSHYQKKLRKRLKLQLIGQKNKMTPILMKKLMICLLLVRLRCLQMMNQILKQ